MSKYSLILDQKALELGSWFQEYIDFGFQIAQLISEGRRFRFLCLVPEADFSGLAVALGMSNFRLMNSSVQMVEGTAAQLTEVEIGKRIRLKYSHRIVDGEFGGIHFENGRERIILELEGRPTPHSPKIESFQVLPDFAPEGSYRFEPDVQARGVLGFKSQVAPVSVIVSSSGSTQVAMDTEMVSEAHSNLIGADKTSLREIARIDHLLVNSEQHRVNLYAGYREVRDLLLTSDSQVQAELDHAGCSLLLGNDAVAELATREAFEKLGVIAFIDMSKTRSQQNALQAFRDSLRDFQYVADSQELRFPDSGLFWAWELISS